MVIARESACAHGLTAPSCSVELIRQSSVLWNVFCIVFDINMVSRDGLWFLSVWFEG